MSDSSNVEIILDSGADVSALPRNYGDVGVEVGQHEAQFIDAQGSPLHVRSTGIARVTFGNVVLKERFIVTDVSIPILALGHLVRAGWSLQANGQEQCLVKGNKSFKVGFKRSSLCAVGSIKMISDSSANVIDGKPSTLPGSDSGMKGSTASSDDASTSDAKFIEFCREVDAAEFVGADVATLTKSKCSSDVKQQLSINATSLQPVLEHLGPGWNKLSPQLFSITTMAPEYRGTTLCPSDDLMWLRTTLVKFTDGWYLFEFCKQIADLETMTEKLKEGRGFQGVLTIADVFALSHEQLVFDVDNRDLPAFAQQVDQSPDEMQAEAEECAVPTDVEVADVCPPLQRH